MTREHRFLTAEWRNLVMLNYEIDPETLIGRVPAGCELDSWAGHTFVSVVGFQFLHTRVRGVPIPWHRHFEEVNLRFYVRRKVEDHANAGYVEKITYILLVSAKDTYWSSQPTYMSWVTTCPQELVH